MAVDFLIYPVDVQRAGYCISGARKWFRVRGWDFRDFVKNGISAELLLSTQDAMAIRTVEMARDG